MKGYFRFLRKNMLYTIIEVVGMATALAFVLFIGTFVINQYMTDVPIKRQGNIYVGHSEIHFCQSATVKDNLGDKFPEIQEMCRIISDPRIPVEITIGENKETPIAIMTDKNFFGFFKFPLIVGSENEVLAAENSVVISKSCANRLFGDEDPLGKTLKINLWGNNGMLTVSGIFKDFENTHFPHADIIYGIDFVSRVYSDLTRNGQGITAFFFKLMKGTDTGALEKKMETVLKEHDMLYKLKLFDTFHLTPFKDINKLELEFFSPFEHITDADFISLFLATGVLLLLFAVLNYISLTVAQTGFRAKEMASRRLLGTQKNSIICRYISETFILTFISFALALLLTWIFSPYVSELIGQKVSPLGSRNWQPNVVFMIVIVILLSLTSGLIPALVISKYKPIDIVRGSFLKANKLVLGKILIGVQCVVTFITLAVSITMMVQLKYMIDKPMGYQKDNIIMVADASKPSDYCVDELKSLPFVEKTGWVQTPPMSASQNVFSIMHDGHEVRFIRFVGDTAAFDILGFEIISRTSAPVADALWLTESARVALNVDYDCKMLELQNSGGIPVCGIIRDYYRGDACHRENADLLKVFYIVEMDYEKDVLTDLRQLAVKVAGDENEAEKAIRKFYRDKGFSEEDIIVKTYNHQNLSVYENENKNLKLMIIFNFLTLLLTGMALFAISTYYARQHAKEVAIRKVMGCGRGRLFAETSSGFLKAVGIALLAAIPFAYFIAGKWLEGYSYRIGNYLWIYLAAAVIILAITLIAICWQMLRLINSKPVKSLKTE